MTKPPVVQLSIKELVETAITYARNRDPGLEAALVDYYGAGKYNARFAINETGLTLEWGPPVPCASSLQVN